MHLILEGKTSQRPPESEPEIQSTNLKFMVTYSLIYPSIFAVINHLSTILKFMITYSIIVKTNIGKH